MKTRFLSFVFILISIIAFSSCASSKKIVQKERSETFIADIDPIYIDDIHLYSTLSLNNPKICDYEIEFYPRTNSISMQGRIMVDSVYVVFNYAERVKLFEAAQEYITRYENGEIKDEKPTKKNAFYNSETSIMWGTLGLSHSLKVKYSANTEYLEKDKPYFRLKFDATDDYTDRSTSPSFSIYISPSQFKTFMELCNQEALEARCDEVIEKAEAF